MRARAAQVQPGDRCAILRPARHRAHDEQLIQRHLAVIDVAAGQAVSCLKIKRRESLRMSD